MSSEKLRSARIILLRATHFPHVVAIWVFEVGSDYWSGTRSTRSTWMSTMGRPDSSACPKRHTLKPSLNSPRPFAAANLVQASMDGRRNGNSQHQTQLPENSVAELKALVTNLGSQVNELVTVVAAQQNNQQPHYGDPDV